MRGHPLRVAMLLVWSVWFGLIVPGHQRGQIALPGGGGDAVACEAGRCCSEPASSGDKQNDDPVRSCAICKIVATLDVPPAINADAPSLGLLHLRPPFPPLSIDAIENTAIPHGRAPPFLA